MVGNNLIFLNNLDVLIVKNLNLNLGDLEAQVQCRCAVSAFVHVCASGCGWLRDWKTLFAGAGCCSTPDGGGGSIARGPHLLPLAGYGT